jgi:hypothetical protein
VYDGVYDFTFNNNSGCGTSPATYTCPGAIRVASSHDGANSFPPPVTVDPAYNLGCPGPLVLQIYGFTGGNFCEPLHGTDGYIQSFPRVAAGPRQGEVYIVWFGGAPQKPDRIFFAASRNGGRTWTHGRAVGIPPGQASDQQHRPAISVAPDGRIDIAYYDLAYYDKTRGFGLQNVDWIHSNDGGRHFSRPERMNNRQSDTKIAHQSFGYPDFGAFLGLASTNRSVSIAWTDTRRGRPANKKQDVYFAQAYLP